MRLIPILFLIIVSVSCCTAGYRVFENHEIIFHYPASWRQVSFIHPPYDVERGYEYAITVAEPGGELRTMVTVEKLKADYRFPVPDNLTGEREVTVNGYRGVEFIYPENGSMVRATTIVTPRGRYAVICKADRGDFEMEKENFDLVTYSFRVKQ
ncbi:hypothetical protein [Methanothermobacter marburgensis]|uniref:hypothetical protein n=1 Tax=Methanothermobacter marburgensis TaxID=145263 RepID=UPI0035B918F4